MSDYNGDDLFRTSETCDLPYDDPTVVEIDRRITELTGLDPQHGEPMQGQRYAVGQEFKGHTDYFEPRGADFAKYCTVSGQRTWTVMIYLNEPEAGGATRFKAIDKIVQPEVGKLLAWNNLRPDGRVNPSTLHHGMKVRAGTKYVITKWFRERSGRNLAAVSARARRAASDRPRALDRLRRPSSCRGGLQLRAQPQRERPADAVGVDVHALAAAEILELLVFACRSGCAPRPSPRTRRRGS